MTALLFVQVIDEAHQFLKEFLDVHAAGIVAINQSLQALQEPDRRGVSRLVSYHCAEQGFSFILFKFIQAL